MKRATSILEELTWLIFTNIVRTLHYTSTHAEQEYSILLFTEIFSNINKHLYYIAELDSLATQERLVINKSSTCHEIS